MLPTDKRVSAAKRGYNGRWRKARLAFLKSNPQCVICKRLGYKITATVVDHIKPHKGDQVLFWDKSNWQPLCKRHHDSDKQRLEKSGRVIGCGVDGVPLDANHHWNV